MALYTRSEGIKRVPWFSLSQWQSVYEDIYSNDEKLQQRGYETLLIWKGRMPKLPVGVECTLFILQMCLRDREWTPKINIGELPMYYENDLRLMYSTAIMKFLNHISNIGHTKQTSLFQIAKQLRIPEWIINLRHDAAHGHELPAIGLLRMAANVLLAWLHEEYWRAEGQSLETEFSGEKEIEDVISPDGLVDLVELWISVGLYIEAGYSIVAALPDKHLRDSLKELYIYVKSSKKDLSSSAAESVDEAAYRLTIARSYLLTEIANNIRQNKNTRTFRNFVVNLLTDSDVYLPTSEFLELFLRKSNEVTSNGDNQLPKSLVIFWQPLIVVLHENHMLDVLMLKLMGIVSSSNEEKEKKKSAALWLRTIGEGLLKLKNAQKVAQIFQCSQNKENQKLSQKIISKKVQEIINKEHLNIKSSIWLGINSEIPEIFANNDFVSEIMLYSNEYAAIFAAPFLDLIIPPIDAEKKESLLQLLRIQTAEEIVDPNSSCNIVYTVEDLKSLELEKSNFETIEKGQNAEEEILQVVDTKVHSLHWKIAPEHLRWADCPFGVLPWQLNSIEVSKIEENSPRIVCPAVVNKIVPGFIGNSKLLTEGRVNWNSVLRKNQREKRKRQKYLDAMVDQAIKVVKTKKI